MQLALPPKKAPILGAFLFYSLFLSAVQAQSDVLRAVQVDLVLDDDTVVQTDRRHDASWANAPEQGHLRPARDGENTGDAGAK